MEMLWTHIYLIGKALQQDAMQTQWDSLVEKIKDMERVMNLIVFGLGIDTSSHPQSILFPDSSANIYLGGSHDNPR